MGAIVKAVSKSLSSEMIVFFRNVFALIFIIPWAYYRRPAGGMKTKRFHLHLLRSVFGLSAMYCYFYALAHMKLAEAVLLSYTTPLFIPVIAYVWIGEEVSRFVRIAVMLGFFGIVLILKPGIGLFQAVALVGLCGGVLASFAVVTIRRMSTTEPPTRIVFYYTMLCTAISAVPLAWVWQSPQGVTWLLLIFAGIVAVIGQMFMTKGYQVAPVAQVGPFIYATVVFASILGLVFWRESLDTLTIIGAVLVCFAGIIATIRTGKNIEKSA
jgi:drug/metabolite transporter (DMT)-like permease